VGVGCASSCCSTCVCVHCCGVIETERERERECVCVCVCVCVCAPIVCMCCTWHLCRSGGRLHVHCCGGQQRQLHTTQHGTPDEQGQGGCVLPKCTHTYTYTYTYTHTPAHMYTRRTHTHAPAAAGPELRGSRCP
jgi:hypothetical protein